ncbi:MAG: tetratricopeptide repeat protein [Kiritimatiellae bacterium]|nr:tetratricopeptide repeat protein [Kiritimatiellia bacterium]
MRDTRNSKLETRNAPRPSAGRRLVAPLRLPLLLLWLLGQAAVPARAADDLMTAHAALADGLYGVAERHLVHYLEQNRARPRDCVPALLWLCQSLAAQGRPADLLAALDVRPEVTAAGGTDGGFDFWRARALLDAGRPRAVLELVNRLPLGQHAEEYAVGLRRVAARASLALGDREGARAWFTALDAATNLAVRAGNLLEWAQVERADGKLTACLGLLERQAALGAGEDAAAAIEAGTLLRAQALRELRRESESEKLLLQLARNGAAAPASRAEAWVALAALAAAGGRTNDVLASGREAMLEQVPPTEAWRIGMLYGRVLIGVPELTGEGAAWLKRLIREQPGAPASAEAQAALAAAWLAAGSNEQAVAEYRIYLETYDEPERVPAALRGKATALFRMGAFEESAAAFQQAAAAFTNAEPRAECLLQAANALHAAKRFEQAAAVYTQVAGTTNAGPLAATAAFMAADALERMGDLRAAEAAFRTLSENVDDDDAAESMLRLAALRERRRDTDAAVAAYSRVIEQSTNSVHRGQALLGRGRVRYGGYQFDAAIADFASAREALPSVAAEAAYLQAMALYGAGRDEDAWQICQTFAQRYPGAPQLADVHLWMAKHSYNRQSFEEAQQRFLDCVARWPREPWADAALLWAGRAAFRRSEFPAAVEILARLSRDYPGSAMLPEARFVQADALCELARFEEAILVLDEIINRYPESEWVTPAWLRKGDSLFALSSDAPARCEDAIRAYAVVTARPDVTTEMSLQAAYKTGRCLEKLERNDEALEQYYDRVVVRFLRERGEGVWHSAAAQNWFARAALQAAELLEARGDPDAAVRVLRRVEQAGVPGQADARERIERLRTEYRWGWQPTQPAPEETAP